MIKIFLGGTTKGYDWRKVLDDRFDYIKFVELFNPIVEEWDEKAREKENKYKEVSDINVYVLTPYMEGCYSIAEVVDDSNKRPEKTVFVYLSEIKSEKEIRRFTKEMLHSLEAVAELVKSNGGKCFTSMDELIDYIREFINK